jgi:putative nucleotidyltransferase with HDIG domain
MSALMHVALPEKSSQVRPTVLVVDDEAGPRDALKVILRPFFNIQAAGSASAAIDVLNSQRIDLITLDQKLPDRQGLDLLQEIKHDHADVEVIIITGYGSLKAAMDGIRHGAAGYLLKPFNVTELVTLVNQTLHRKQRLDYLRRFVQYPESIWESEASCAATWNEIRSGYAAINPQPDGSTGDEATDFRALLPLLSDLLEAKERELLNHCSRVSFYATLLANRMDLTDCEQKSLALGAFLHDIGRIVAGPCHFADDAIRSLGGTQDHKRHTELGVRMIAPLALPAEVGQIIGYHHERWDGTGYPHGLQGEGIPLLARIVCLAQAFDHLTAELPDRSSLSLDEACDFITGHTGDYFDPILTSLFVKVVQECKASLPAMAIATNPSRPPHA